MFYHAGNPENHHQSVSGLLEKVDSGGHFDLHGRVVRIGKLSI